MSDDEQALFTTRAQLADALAVACELEHGLSLQYLFAAFSLKKEADEGLGLGEHLTACRRWAGEIFFIAAQEMLHLAQASNLLLAIGGAPHLARPNFPQLAGIYPPGLGWDLTAFSPGTLARFIAYESPAAPAVSGSSDDPVVPTRLTHASIAEMYSAIEAAFRTMRIPDGDLFIGDPRDQIVGEMVDFPQLVKVVDRATAQQAITLIMVQGEGSPADRPDSHFGVFSTIQRQLGQLTAADPTFRPARPVADNPLSGAHPDCNPDPAGARLNLIADPTTIRVQDIFTSSYDMLLLALFRFFAGGSTDAAAPAVKRVVFELMMNVVRPLGDLLTRLPMGDGYGALTAGPSFETFPEIELLPHGAAARVLIAERLETTQLDAIEVGGLLDRRSAAVLVSVADHLGRLAQALRAVS